MDSGGSESSERFGKVPEPGSEGFRKLPVFGRFQSHLKASRICIV